MLVVTNTSVLLTKPESLVAAWFASCTRTGTLFTGQVFFLSPTNSVRWLKLIQSADPRSESHPVTFSFLDTPLDCWGKQHCCLSLLSPAASLSLGLEQHSAEGTLQSLEQTFGTIFWPICDSSRSHYWYLDKNWNSICLSHERTWGFFLSRAIQMFSSLLLLLFTPDIWCWYPAVQASLCLVYLWVIRRDACHFSSRASDNLPWAVIGGRLVWPAGCFGWNHSFTPLWFLSTLIVKL